MRAEATGQRSRHPRILLQDNYTLNHTSPNLQPSSTADVNVGLGLRSGLKYYNSTDIYRLESRGSNTTLTGVPASFLPAARMVQLEASRSSSAGSRPFLPLVPIPCGRLKKGAFPLRRVSETFPKGLLPFPAPEQFSPVAGGTPQTWATVSLRPSIVMQLIRSGVQSFRYK